MIDKRVLRDLILEVMRRTPRTQFNSILNDVENLVIQRDLFPNRGAKPAPNIDARYSRERRLEPADKAQINEVVWDLIVERILTPGYDDSNPNYPFVRLTSFGEAVLSDSAPHHYDPEGYLEYLNTTIPDLDPVLKQYLAEGLGCFRRGLYFASAVMIGAASEKAVLVLLKATVSHISDLQKKEAALQLLERPRLPAIFGTITETLSSLSARNVIPYNVHQGSAEHLMSLFEMIRVQRNDAVHPAAGQVDRTKVFLSLQTLPAALQCVSRLVAWLDQNVSAPNRRG